MVLAVVDAKAVLEIAERAVGLTMIAQRRAAGRDGFEKNLADRSGEPVGALGRSAVLAREAAGGAARRQAGPMQGLADIDIAEARDERLVEQRSLERRRLAGEKRREPRAVELVAERFDPDIAKQCVIGEIAPSGSAA